MLQEAERKFLIFLGPGDNRGWLRYLGETLLPLEGVQVTFSGKAGLFKQLLGKGDYYQGVILRWDIEQEEFLRGVVSRIRKRRPSLPINAVGTFLDPDDIRTALRCGVTRMITGQYDKDYLVRDLRRYPLLLET